MRKILIILLVISLQSAYAMYGARPMGMGQAFTAISDDANAAYYNPAGMALNPGIDITGSTLITNRNEAIGENLAAMKMCFEVPMNPFAWILGIGTASLVAYEGAKYLSKGWGPNKKKTKKGESLSKEVKKHGTKKVKDPKKIAKEKAKEAAKKAAKKTIETTVSVAKEAAHAAFRNPWYYQNYNRPSYWGRRHREDGKAQFALGLTWVFDKNESATVDQNTGWYSLTLASGYEERIAIGTNINIYDIEIPSVKAKGFGGSLDLGIIARPLDQIAFGATVHDMLTTDIHFSNGAIQTYGMRVDSGVALIPIPELTIAADIHNIFSQNNANRTMHYGIEARPVGGIALRAGLSDKSKTAGLGIALGPFILEYAYLGGIFNRTQTVGATWKL